MSKQHVALFVGIYSQYREFRHGNSRPVYNPARPNSRAKLSGQAKEHVVKRVVEIMGAWTHTPFEHEGNCRHGIRAGLCIEGASWTRADLDAAAIVEEALRRLRAHRPTWEEGQWTYTQSPDQCSWCQGEIDGESRNSGRRFCSPECARLALEHMARKSARYGGAVVQAARSLIAKDKATARECQECGTGFKSVVHDARFCSRRCLAISRERDRKERLAGETRHCKGCGVEFTPATESAVYCSRRCGEAAKQRTYRAEKGLGAYHQHCRWCGGHFVSKMPWAEYCCQEHQLAAKLASKPRKKPLPLTPEIFDFVVTIPANQIAATWLNAERFDRLLEGA